MDRMADGTSPFDNQADVASMLDVVTELLTVEPGELTDGELADGLLALNRLRSMVEASASALGAVFDGRTIWAGDGARSGGAWLAARSEWSRHEGNRLLATGRELQRCPHVAAAYRSGLIGPAKVELLLKAREGFEELFAEQERELVDLVRSRTVRASGDQLRAWRKTARSTVGDGDDGPPPPDTTDTVYLSSTFQGRWDLRGDLDPVEGEILDGALNAEIDRLWRIGTFHRDDQLSLPQRRSKALVELVRRGALPTNKHGQARPLVTVFIDHRELIGLPIDSPAEMILRRSQLGSGTPIHRATAERLACEGSVAYVFGTRRADGTTTIADAVSPSRTATAAQRRALRERDHGCVFPGCDAPVDWCDAHHVIFAEHGGPTTLANLVLLCRHHHHRVHEGGFRLARSADGTIHVWRPDGTPLPDASPGSQLPIQPPPEEPTRCEVGDPGAATGPPRDAPPRRPATRFRRLAERRTREEAEIADCRRIVLARLADDRRRRDAA